MTKMYQFAAAAVLGLGLLSAPVLGQGAMQTLATVKVDPTSVATGYRTSKVIGSSVRNEAKEVVGTVDDLIITQNATRVAPARSYYRARGTTRHDSACLGLASAWRRD